MLAYIVFIYVSHQKIKKVIEEVKQKLTFSVK